MNYYLLIIFLISNFFLFFIFNLNTYGYEVAKVNYLNEFKNIAFVPIKSKILPQYDESTQQSISQIKSQPDIKANDIKANDINKSNNSEKSAAPSMGIKILSPKSGKEIPVGNLTIFGASSDNEKSNCSVSVDWNNQKPFQEAKAAGPYGNDDYSSWTFTYSPSYHTIENGLNDLTSKLECVENSKVSTKWHSINVTGVTTKDANPTSTLVYHDPLGVLPQLKPLSTNPSANTTGIASNETKITPTKLSTHLELSKAQIFPGESQNFTVKISDSKTLQRVEGANVVIKVMQGSLMLDKYNGTSNASGEYSSSWTLNPDIPSGKYDVLVSASANGYEPASMTGSFGIQRQLLVEASLLKDLVVSGDNQTIDVKVMDANTKEIVSGANVMAKIGKSNEYNGTSDTSGVYSHSWNITSDTPSGKQDVLVSASANGYEPASITGNFHVQRQQLLVEASLLKDLVVPGDKQTIDVKVMDANTNETVPDANVMAKIGKSNEYDGTSDTSGVYSHSWNITSDTPSGKQDVLVSASANGYEPASITGNFQVQRQLLVEASLLKDLVVPGDKQTIDVKVMDANTKETVSGASVKGKIGGKMFSEKTDDSGVISYSWDTPPTIGGNKYQGVLDVSADGYPKVMKTISFKMDKPQNLLEPPISNYEDKIVKVNNKALDNNVEHQSTLQECTNMLSSIGCSAEVNDKPVLNLTTTDDKPVLNLTTTDDKPVLNLTTTDDKPVLNTDSEKDNIQNEKNQTEKNAYDFLSSITK
ncbi:MAG: carboxypeptidase regulatory-like domain-containing protein [Thaumarchaeota archaeon]|nr:MAG: carboxypeptidase regulatory-like domain-containing protein [Nitrososphaerota archaeon]